MEARTSEWCVYDHDWNHQSILGPICMDGKSRTHYLSRQNRKTIGQICTCVEKSILSGTADCQYSPAGPVNTLLYHSHLLCTCLAVELSHSIPS